MQKPDFRMPISRTSSIRTKHQKRVQMSTYLINLTTTPYIKRPCTTPLKPPLLQLKTKLHHNNELPLYLTIYYFSKWRKKGHNGSFKNYTNHNWLGTGSNYHILFAHKPKSYTIFNSRRSPLSSPHSVTDLINAQFHFLYSVSLAKSKNTKPNFYQSFKYEQKKKLKLKRLLQIRKFHQLHNFKSF